MKNRNAIYREKNHEHILAYKAEYRSKNKGQITEYNKLYYEKNKEKLIANAIENAKKNLPRKNASQRKWHAANVERLRPAKILRMKSYNSSIGAKEKKLEWKKENPHLVTAMAANRRAQKKSATPSWANSFFIREAYHLAKLRTKCTGFVWEVDHIYPLQSPIVCGLHVEHNLQVITATMNRSKGNRVTHHA